MSGDVDVEQSTPLPATTTSSSVPFVTSATPLQSRASAPSLSMTADSAQSFKASLLAHLSASPPFLAAKSQLMASLATTLTKRPPARSQSHSHESATGPRSMTERLIVSLILHYLSLSGHQYSVPLLLAELGVESLNQACFSIEDESTLLRLGASLRPNVFRELQSSLTDTNQSVLALIIQSMVKAAPSVLVTAGAQTDGTTAQSSTSASQSEPQCLDAKLAAIDTEAQQQYQQTQTAVHQAQPHLHPHPQLAHPPQPSITEQMLAYQNELRTQMEHEFTERITAFQRTELQSLKHSEKQQYQTALAQAQQALQQHYQQQLELLTQRADSLTAELLVSKNQLETESFQQRQLHLAELAEVKHREQEIRVLEHSLLEKQHRLNGLIQQSEAKIAFIDDKLTKSHSELTSHHEAIVSQRDELIKELRAENQSLNHLVHNLQFTNQNGSSENLSLKESLTKLQLKLEGIVSERDSLQSRSSSVASQESELRTLTQQLAAAQIALKDAELQHTASVTEIHAHYTSTLTELNTRHRSAMVRLSHEWKEAYDNLTREFEAGSEEKFQLEQEIEQWKSMVRRKNRVHNHYKSESDTESEHDNEDAIGQPRVRASGGRGGHGDLPRKPRRGWEEWKERDNAALHSIHHRNMSPHPSPRRRVGDYGSHSVSHSTPFSHQAARAPMSPSRSFPHHVQHQRPDKQRTPMKAPSKWSDEEQHESYRLPQHPQSQLLSPVHPVILPVIVTPGSAHSSQSTVINSNHAPAPAEAPALVPDTPTTTTVTAPAPITPFQRLLPVDTAQPSPLNGRALTFDELSSTQSFTLATFASPTANASVADNVDENNSVSLLVQSMASFNDSDFDQSLDEDELKRQAIIAAQQARASLLTQPKPAAVPVMDKASKRERAEAEQKVREERERLKQESEHNERHQADVDAVVKAYAAAEAKAAADREKMEAKAIAEREVAEAAQQQLEREEAESHAIAERERREAELAVELRARLAVSTSRRSSRRRRGDDSDEEQQGVTEAERLEQEQYEQLLRQRLEAQQAKHSQLPLHTRAVKPTDRAPTPMHTETVSSGESGSMSGEALNRMAQLVHQARERRAQLTSPPLAAASAPAPAARHSPIADSSAAATTAIASDSYEDNEFEIAEEIEIEGED